MHPLLVLRCVRGLGVAGLRRLRDDAGSAEAALRMLAADQRALAEARAAAVAAAARAKGIQVVPEDADAYPAMLRDLEDPPPVLFALGNLSHLQGAAVALVGTRGATPYGVRIATRLATAAASAGVTVVSGMARGIDTVVHEAALAGGGGTIAVLGTGVDVAYPRENARLHERLAEQGLVLSEMLPGAPAHPGSFPRRNRIVAALADVCVVVEAGERSGALITAGAANAIGRVVGAVPGPVDVAASAGANALLRDGRQVVTGPDDLLGLVHLTPRGRQVPPVRARLGQGPVPDLGADEAMVLAAVREAPRLADELVTATGLAPARLAAALGTLDTRGLATIDAAGWVCASAEASGS